MVALVSMVACSPVVSEAPAPNEENESDSLDVAVDTAASSENGESSDVGASHDGAVAMNTVPDQTENDPNPVYVLPEDDDPFWEYDDIVSAPIGWFPVS